MQLLGNIIWIVFGGILVFFEYLIVGIVYCITIVGIPFGLQCFKLAYVGLVPFGVQIIPRATGAGSGCLYTIMNIIWFFIGGIWISLTHLGLGIIFCITIIGIPFGMQHFKLMGLAFSPFGKDIR